MNKQLRGDAKAPGKIKDQQKQAVPMTATPVSKLPMRLNGKPVPHPFKAGRDKV